MLAVVGVASAEYRSGSVSSRENFLYGKFVARMKAPNQKGTVASFFTYKDAAYEPGTWNELDIEIVPSVGAKPLSTNMIYGEGHEKVESHEYASKFDPKDEWHTYTLEWTPDYISWNVDGKNYRKVTHTEPSVTHMHQAQTLRMNFWTPTFESWGKDLVADDMPWYLLFDYIEVHHYNPHTHGFELHWRDDFNYFDPGRWFKQSGTFEANSSIFHTGNVYTEDGNLVLKMEPEHAVHRTHHMVEHQVEKVVKHVPKQPLHARDAHLAAHADGIEIPAVHDAFVDSHLFGKHVDPEKHMVSHTKQEYVDHDDQLYHDQHGELMVDHHDTTHFTDRDVYKVDNPPDVHHSRHPYSHEEERRHAPVAHDDYDYYSPRARAHHRPLEHDYERSYDGSDSGDDFVHEDIPVDRYYSHRGADYRDSHSYDRYSGDSSDWSSDSEEFEPRPHAQRRRRRSRSVYSESEDEYDWHHAHQKAHSIHPRSYYEREEDPYRFTRYDVQHVDDDRYIQNPYEFEMEWKSMHPDVDHDFEHRFKDHEDHWEEHYKHEESKEGKKKAEPAPAPAPAPAPTPAPAPAPAPAPTPAPAPAKAATKAAAMAHHAVDYHRSAHHGYATHHPVVHDSHHFVDTHHGYAEDYHHGGHPAVHAVEAEHLWHGDEHVKKHDADKQTEPVYEPHHAKHDPATAGWMHEFEQHEYSHHPSFHTKEQEVVQHHYLDRTHKPYHEHHPHDYDRVDEHHDYVEQQHHSDYTIHEPERMHPEYTPVEGYAMADHGFVPSHSEITYDEHHPQEYSSHGYDHYYVDRPIVQHEEQHYRVERPVHYGDDHHYVDQPVHADQYYVDRPVHQADYRVANPYSHFLQ